MSASILRRDDCPLVPWKNGLGRTRQLAVYPPGAGSDDFLWRVSVAEVTSAAPFSTFPGVDRHIVLLDGAGFRMTLDDRMTHVLDTPWLPFAFAGEASVAVALAGGPTVDFNLMARRAQACGEVIVWRGPGIYPIDAHTVFVYAARGDIATPDGVLEPGDAWLAPAVRSCATLAGDAVALAVRITHPV
jgi:hypothetical protein